MTEEKTDTPPLLIEQTEYCVCTRCDATIRRDHVFQNLKRSNGIEPTRQNLRAWCEHCQTGFGLTRVLRNNMWVIESDVKILAGPALAALKARVDLVDDVRQIRRTDDTAA